MTPNPASRDPYEILGVDRNASPEEIKAAFKELAKQHHPDRNPGDPTAAERFKTFNTAYQLLSDPEKRAAFDRYGAQSDHGGVGQGVHVEFTNLEDLFNSLLGSIGFQRGNRGDLRKEVTLTFQEAAFGCVRRVTYERTVTCHDCHGSGAQDSTGAERCPVCAGRGRIRFAQGLLGMMSERDCTQCRGRGILVKNPCKLCQGSGLIVSQNTLDVTIPPGTEDGTSTLVPGAGHASRAGRAAGDLELVFHVEDHPFFRRKNEDIFCAVPLSFIVASLGGEVEVPTLDGKAKVRVPQGTQHGAVLRLKGKGIPKRSGGRGDQHIEVLIQVPTELTAHAKELLEQLAKELGQEVTPHHKSFVEKLKDLFG